MTRTQLSLLFACSLVPWIVGNGMLPLLPVYATQLGADPAVVGFYLSFAFLSLTAGTLGAGWLSDRLQSRKLPLVASCLGAVPATWLMGQATNIWQLALLTATFCLMAGIAVTAANILAGLLAGKEERGRVFGVMALASPLGSLIGGLATGFLADQWGYPAMFAALALLLFLPLAGLLLPDKPASQPRPGRTADDGAKPGLGRSFYLLFAASLAAMIAYYVSLLGRSLSMAELGFSATAIAGTTALAGAITLPLPLLAGWLSDRLGRKSFLALSYLAGAAGLVLLALSVSLWHFWLVIFLVSVLASVSRAVGNALVTDLVPRASLARAISLFGTTVWMAGIVGNALSGFAIQTFGQTLAFLLAALLPIASILLLIPVEPSRAKAFTVAGGSG
jgi:DHA1 family multidrug resistance protein-like MFS transporter